MLHAAIRSWALQSVLLRTRSRAALLELAKRRFSSLRHERTTLGDDMSRYCLDALRLPPRGRLNLRRANRMPRTLRANGAHMTVNDVSNTY